MIYADSVSQKRPASKQLPPKTTVALRFYKTQSILHTQWIMAATKWSSSTSKTMKSMNDTEQASSSKSLGKWKVMWMKLIKQKNKMLQRSSVHNNQHQLPYDEYNYLQNFDQGFIADSEEPDILSRSFSVRFANPSTVFRRMQ
uniref:Uncharacterized protein n=2 Tax=Daucus carota subsp. sativus TaxID=79200 RepID=A0A161WSP3_DAUCS